MVPCAEFDALLERRPRSRFDGAKAADVSGPCRNLCLLPQLLADAEAGRNSLRSLQEAEPPAGSGEQYSCGNQRLPDWTAPAF